MNPRLRVALAAVPALSLGLLAWLPFLWLYLTRPHDPRRYGRSLVLTTLGTACAVGMVLGAGDNEPMKAFGGCLLLAHIAAATVILWVSTGQQAAVKDPYA